MVHILNHANKEDPYERQKKVLRTFGSLHAHTKNQPHGSFYVSPLQTFTLGLFKLVRRKLRKSFGKLISSVGFTDEHRQFCMKVFRINE